MVDEYKRCLLFVVLLHSWLETHFEEIERAITTPPTMYNITIRKRTCLFSIRHHTVARVFHMLMLCVYTHL